MQQERDAVHGTSPDAPEGTKGFVLNHIISQLLPEKGSGYRYANSDPITGQAAWFDLRVKIEKAGPNKPGELTEPQFETMKVSSTVPRGNPTLRYGEKDK